MNGIEAMRHLEPHGRILCIRSSADEDYVLIQVQDSGSGWTTQVGSCMFEPFFTTKPDGIGMGLTISRSIIEGHGGKLWAELEAPHGAVLNFTIPVQDRS
jgi:C4-dicarboxylate-specific signal transduction histidine kinase